MINPFKSRTVLALMVALVPAAAHAQRLVAPPTVMLQQQQPIGQQTADRAERQARRFGAGLHGACRTFGCWPDSTSETELPAQNPCRDRGPNESCRSPEYGG